MEDIIFADSKGNKILGTISIPKQAKSIVIISHGFSSQKESKLYIELQDELNKLGIGSLRYDYYGHGKIYCNDAKFSVTKDVTLTKCVDSIKAAILFVRRKGDFNIGLVGSSFGGLISLIAASQDSKIHALALKSPVVEPIEFWKERLGNIRLGNWKKEGIMHFNELGENFELNYAFYEDLHKYNTLEMAKKIKCSVLLVHGDGDTVVPITQSQKLSRIINTDIKIIKRANHDYAGPSQYNEMKSLIVDFFSEKFNFNI